MSDYEFMVIFLFLLGLVFGSFANVIIYRLPKGESIVFPGSFCRSCNTPIPWYRNIPVLSWFIQKGRCASCGATYSFRYPLVELLMGCLFALAGWQIGFQWILLEALIFIFCVTTASFIDIDHMILPDKFTLSGIAIALFGAAINPERAFMDGLLGAAFGFGFLWAVAYIYYVFRGREGMGGGDIKLIAWIGALLGWQSIPFVILVSSLIGSFAGIALALRTKDGIHNPIPFGPYLAGAAILYLLFDGSNLSEWYLSLHGL